MFRGTDQIDWLKNDLKTIKVVFSSYLDMRDKKILLFKDTPPNVLLGEQNPVR